MKIPSRVSFLFTHSFILCVYVCVQCIHVCLYVCGHSHLCAIMWMTEVDIICLLQLYLTPVFDSGSVNELGTHHDSARMAGQEQAPGVHLFLHLDTEIINVHSGTPYFAWLLRIQSHNLRLEKKSLYSLNHLSIPHLRFLKKHYKNVIAPISTTGNSSFTSFKLSI